MVGSNGLEPSTSRLSGVRSNHLSYEPISVAVRLPSGQTCGGDEQNRTVDPLLARQVLSQLSYAPVLKVCAWVSPPSEFPKGPSKLNSVRLLDKLSQYLFRSTWMFEPSIKRFGSP